MDTRDTAYCGLFGALALALPLAFHALGLAGALFLPMYWPLVALAFLVPARRAALVAAVVPWASALLTGVPLLWPPLAAVLSAELAVQVAALGLFARPPRNGRGGGLARTTLVLAAVLVFGRALHAGLVWALAQAFPNLPAGVLAGASLLAGWPGVAVLLVFIPVFVGARARRDGVCEVRFLRALRRLRLPEGAVLVCAQALRWFEALSRDADMLARTLALRRALNSSSPGRAVSPEPPPPSPIPSTDVDVVVVRDLRVQYPGASEPALALASLRVQRGERIALLGPNGGGKTTLLSVLAGFAPFAGDVRVFGLVPRGRARRALWGRLGVLFENPDDQFLFPTVREDVEDALRRAGVPPAARPARVDAALALLGLPPGNRPVASLSRGQRQRAALAVLFAAAPDLLLLDEPTSALDDAEKVRLASVLVSFPGTVLVATHDRPFASLFSTRFLSLPRQGGFAATAPTPPSRTSARCGWWT